VDHVYILEQGKIIKEGTQDIIKTIKEEWFTDLAKK
jgi:Fe-S cluster assembly ATPase SufC